jgi:hypothetical protein
MLWAARQSYSVLQFMDGVDHGSPQVTPAPVRIVDPVIDTLSGAQSRLRAIPLDHIAC